MSYLFYEGKNYLDAAKLVTYKKIAIASDEALCKRYYKGRYF
jgi:hypothetical protein